MTARSWLALAPILLQLTGPHVTFAPATIRLQVHIEPVASDRLVVVELDGPLFFRSFDLAVEGLAGPKTWTASEFSGIPAGEYELRAQVGSSRTRVRASTTQRLFVQ